MEHVQSIVAHLEASKIPISVQIIGVALVPLIIYQIYCFATSQRPFPQYKVISLEEKGLSPLASWIRKGEDVLAKGRKVTNGPFQVVTGTGPKLMLPNRYTNELRNHPDLSFTEATATEFFPTWPGFEAFNVGLHSNSMITETVRVNLTQSLNLITDDLVDETDDALRVVFPSSKEWQNVEFKKGVLNLVARLSSRVFLGKELCRNERWLEIAKDYTVHSFTAAMKLRFTPPIVRPLGLLAFKECWQIRQEVHDAKKLITTEVERRKERAQKALDAGKRPPKTADTIGWMYEIASKKKIEPDYVAAQLSLSLAAIHTTTESLLYAIMDCVRHPEIVQPLREEMISTLRENGWSKTTLYKMKLLDSFLKESQRVNTLATYTMSRMVKREIQLSDGTVLPKGAKFSILTSYHDPEVYPEPETFKVDRFAKLRQVPGQENSWQHVSTSPEHLGFGHGEHACPGRFFATNELKIALCFMLLQYDFQAGPDSLDPGPGFEGRRIVRQDFKLQMRTRQPEIDLMGLSKAV